MIGIIRSLLDLDRYKLTMAQFVFRFYKGVRVKYAFTNRTKTEHGKVALIMLIPFIQVEIEKVKKLKLSFSELMQLKNQNIFHVDFLDFFSTMQLCDVNVYINKQGELAVDYEGEWACAMIWETILLSIIAELYARYIALERYHKESNKPEDSELAQVLHGDDKELLNLIFKPYYDNAMVLLEEKIKAFLHHPSIYFFEFGTRRRFTAELQEMILKRLKEAFHKPQFHGSSQFLGTSNEYLAMKLDLKAGGTCAHEIFMVKAGLMETDEEIANSQYDILRQWNEFYGYDLSVALTDTFGSNYFFQNCPEDIAANFSFREDSAIDLHDYTMKTMKLYEKFKISCHDKVIVHSNGLNKNKVIEQDSYSIGKIHKIYGIGTDLSCDVGFNFPHLSMVIKVVEADGRGLVKLSDNLAKAIGKPEDIERYKKIFGYVNVQSEEQVY